MHPHALRPILFVRGERLRKLGQYMEWELFLVLLHVWSHVREAFNMWGAFAKTSCRNFTALKSVAADPYHREDVQITHWFKIISWQADWLPKLHTVLNLLWLALLQHNRYKNFYKTVCDEGSKLRILHRHKKASHEAGVLWKELHYKIKELVGIERRNGCNTFLTLQKLRALN